ncbi:MAG TPA: hypothetical protein DCQ98_03450, partial [Planctomycetaceae bacterium]|nr:hypothetical protein [Planctomycetaceae bacterium]
MTVTGADLDELSELRFEHPGIVAAPKRDENGTVVAGRFVVTVDAAVPAGFYDVRALGRFGLSNPRRFVVDRLPTVVASGNHRSRETAQSIAVGSAVDGRIDPNQRDYYKLELAAGETIVAEAIAAPLDSRAVPTIEVLDLDGRELTRFRGVPERSTVGSFVAPSGGVYLIGVRDLIFGGGPEHFYRLRVHRGPIVERFAPAVVPADGKVAIEVIGFGLGEGATPLEGDSQGRTRRTIELDVPAALAAADRTGRDLLPIAALDEVRVVPLDVVGPDGVTEVLPITVVGGAIVAETESEDEWSSQPTAQSLALPCTVDGRFGEPRDRDWFEFTAKAGENWMIEVLADRLGMPSDPLIAVHRVDTAADGSRTYAQIALADDPGDRAGLIGVDFDLTSDDPSLVFTAPADGTYRLSIDDLFGGTRNDPGVRYLLRVRPLEPRVRLVVQPALGRPGNDQQAVLGTYEVRRGGTERIGVLIHRLEGNAAPIELSVEGLPAGLSCDPVRVEPYVGATQLVVRAADDAAPWSGTVRIIGRWQQGDQARETTALVGALAYGTDNRAVRTAQSRLTDALHLAIVSAETEPVALRPSTLRVVGSRGARIELPLSLVRRNGFDGAVTFNPIVSHGELKVAPIAFEAGKGDGVIVLDMASANLPAGVHQLVLQGDVTFKYVRFPEQIAAAEATVNGIQARQAALTAEREQLAATLANDPAQRETIGGDERLASAALARADAALLDGA